jgi:crotonobetainyl-CoA:carnitine CoA-transferase CaiB-like acyl-CoA transferase
MGTPGVLDGIKIADFSWIGAGPLTAMWLAQHGAVVVRLESATRPDGLRMAGPFKDGIPGINRSGFYASFNTNKLGITVNLNTERGKEVARRLICWADIVVENFTPKAMPAWGLDYESIRAFKPDVIMISLTMQGQDGPHAFAPGFGPMLQGLAGFSELAGWPDRAPVGANVSYPDFCVPHFGATALLAALIHRRRTGEGQYIDLSQYEAAIHFLGPAVLDYTANGRVEKRAGNTLLAGESVIAAPHGAYPCRGGRWLTLAVFDDGGWERLTRLMGGPAWTKQSDFATHAARCAHTAALDERIADWTRGQDGEALVARLQACGIAAGMVKSEQEVLADPQLNHRGHFVTLPHGEIGDYVVEMPAARLSRTPARLHKAAPCLGEDNEYVYKQVLGYNDEEYDRLLVEGVIELYGG